MVTQPSGTGDSHRNKEKNRNLTLAFQAAESVGIKPSLSGDKGYACKQAQPVYAPQFMGTGSEGCWGGTAGPDICFSVPLMGHRGEQGCASEAKGRSQA
ncbi:hypothetical protein JZ751_022448, partial [Albula glossodonta]